MSFILGLIALIIVIIGNLTGKINTEGNNVGKGGAIFLSIFVFILAGPFVFLACAVAWFIFRDLRIGR